MTYIKYELLDIGKNLNVYMHPSAFCWFISLYLSTRAF